MLLTIVVFILVLGVLVLFHEFGHFIAAKRAGIKVEEFGFGFPPRLFGKKKGDTIYSINAIPLGGFVRLYGEDGGNTKDSHSYAHKSLWSRFLVIISGVLMNFVLAWILFTICFMAGINPMIGSVREYKGATVSSKVVVGEILSDSPAQQIGLAPKDQITKIDNQVILTSSDLQNYTKDRPNQKISITYLHDNQTATKETTLNKKDGKGSLGVMIFDDSKVSYPFWKAPYIALVETVRMIGAVATAFGSIFYQLFVHQTVPADGAGPIGIYKFTGQALAIGWIVLLQFVALLSINLGVLNVIPFPALDGGKLLFLAIEKVRRGKKVTPQIENTVHLIGFAILIVLIILISIRDIKRFF